MSPNKTVRVVVLRTAGTNCDEETAYAFAKLGAAVERVHVNRLAGQRRLDRYHILAIPGGFSYGDDIASGKVLANEIRYRMEDDVRRFVKDGKLILGICNGFQVLAKAGLLPRLREEKIEVTLTVNDRARFEDRWVYLRAEDSPCVFVRPGDRFYLPVAHGEGKFVAQEQRPEADRGEAPRGPPVRRAGRRRESGLSLEPERLPGRHRRHLRPHGPDFRPDAAPGTARRADPAPPLDARRAETRGGRRESLPQRRGLRAPEPRLSVSGEFAAKRRERPGDWEIGDCGEMVTGRGCPALISQSPALPISNFSCGRRAVLLALTKEDPVAC